MKDASKSDTISKVQKFLSKHLKHKGLSDQDLIKIYAWLLKLNNPNFYPLLQNFINDL